MGKRIVSGVVAGAMTLFCLLWAEPWAAWLLLGLAFLLGLSELKRLVNDHPAVTIILVALTLWLGVELGGTFFLPFVSGLWVLGFVSLLVWQPNDYRAAFGLGCWVAAGFCAAFFLLVPVVAPGNSLVARGILLALVPLWVGDSLGYFIGGKWGKRFLAPTLSPKKTWEGSIANIIGCLTCAIVLVEVTGGPLNAGILIGLNTGLLGQAGDLLQSRIKRISGVKDSGSFLPGHGGILDRLDSFLLSSVPSLWIIASTPAFHVKLP